MTAHYTRLLLCLVLLGALLAAFGEDAAAAMPTQSDIAILPVMTLAMTADTSKAAWDVVRDLFVLKGYHVTGYAETLQAMAQHEVVPTRLAGVTADGNPTVISWWRNGPEAAEDAAAVKALCATLRVSRVITLFPTAKVPVAGLTNAITRDAKNLAVTLTAAAWGAQTGRCVWEASWTFGPDMKLPYGITGIFGEARLKAMRSAALLPGVFLDGVVNTFSEFFQRDWAIYGTANEDLPMTTVTGAVQKTKRGKVDSILLTWTAPTDPRVVGYAIYRALGELKFIDKGIDEDSRESYRYLVVPITADGIEGNASDTVTVTMK